MIKKKSIIPYIMVGDPSIDMSHKLLEHYYQLGCRTIEIGVPFSDPTADGVTIQNASIRALENGVNIETCLLFIKENHQKYPDIQLVLMSYFNPILRYGIDRFFAEFKGHGLIIPDLPSEEYDILKGYPKKKGLAIIPLISLNTPLDRIKKLVSNSSGFIYLMALKGLTGTKSATVKDTIDILNTIRSLTTTPVIAGFGIRNKDQVDSFLEHFDGVVIASQLIKLIQANQYDQLEHLLKLDTKKPVT